MHSVANRSAEESAAVWACLRAAAGWPVGSRALKLWAGEWPPETPSWAAARHPRRCAADRRWLLLPPADQPHRRARATPPCSHRLWTWDDKIHPGGMAEPPGRWHADVYPMCSGRNASESVRRMIRPAHKLDGHGPTGPMGGTGLALVLAQRRRGGGRHYSLTSQ